MTAISYGLDPVAPVRLYDQPEPKLKLTPRTVGAITAVGLIYAGGGMMLNLAGIEFSIPDILEPKTVVMEVWEPAVPETPVTPVAPASAPYTPTIDQPVATEPTAETIPFTPTADPVLPTTVTEGPVTDEPVLRPEPVPTPPTPPAPPTIRNPSWLAKPTAAQLGRLYPSRAAARGMQGAATMECRVTAQGGVTACVVLRESPEGYGFGDAALASTRYFRLNPRTIDGQAMEGAKVQIPMGFNLAD